MKRINKKTILIIALVYVYSILLVPVIIQGLYDLSMDPDAIIPYVVCRNAYFLVTYILLALAVVLIGREKKQPGQILGEIVLIDIPALWMATLFIQYGALNIFYGSSLIQNFDFLMKVGALLLGVEIYRYFKYVKSKGSRETDSAVKVQQI